MLLTGYVNIVSVRNRKKTFVQINYCNHEIEVASFVIPKLKS